MIKLAISLPTRAIFRTSACIAALMTAAACASLAPPAITYALLWGACKANCEALGWPAITYAPAIGAVIAAVVMAILGMAAYRRTIADRKSVV